MSLRVYSKAEVSEKIETILISTGTRGDASPFIAYAKQLLKMGGRVTLLSNIEHESLALRHAVPFVGICESDWEQIGRDEAAFFERITLPSYRRAFDYLFQRVHQGDQIEVVGRTGNWGAQFAAEKLILPFSRIALQPSAIRRKGHPASALEIGLVNRFRSEIGLSSMISAKSIPEEWSRTICLFPKWFGMPQSLWAESGECSDFQFLDDSEYKPDPELFEFLKDNNPVVISLGSGMQKIENFLEIARSISDKLNYPVLFLSSFSSPNNMSYTPGVIFRHNADHSYILPRARLLINNGGIGTVAQAIRAKIPQIVIPIMWDQPDNARRVEILGFGIKLSLDEALSGLLLDAIKQLTS